MKRERKYKFIEGQLHQQNKQGWVAVPFEYHTIDEITPAILRQLKKIANKKVTFAVEKDIESSDLVSDFLYQVTEGFLPLRKTKGVNFDTVVYSRFTNNYLKDYYKSKQAKTHFAELPDNLSEEFSDEKPDDIVVLMKYYAIAKKKGKLLLLCELFKYYQMKHGESSLIDITRFIPKSILSLFEMNRYFGKTFTNYSQCYIALGNLPQKEYQSLKQRLFSQLKQDVTIV